MRLSKFINKHFFNKDIDIVDPRYTFNGINTVDGQNIKRDELKVGQVIYAAISTTIKEDGKKKRLNQRKDLYMLKDSYGKFVFVDYLGNEYKTSMTGIKIINSLTPKMKEKEIGELLDTYDRQNKEAERLKFLETSKQLGFNFTSLEPDEKLRRTIEAGIKNIWMVGPAGCGKSTMARNVAEDMDLPYLCISCGIGTSATEFIGYKYPTREATRFGEFYAKPSIILIDEITALDPAVAQILNAALANDEIETTTGLVHRHPKCIIIATSNTFGFGCDRQYVANNQLDASTIDRFVGGIVEVTYSAKYESQYDDEVVAYVNLLRKFVAKTSVRKVLSTRMIQAGHNLKYHHFQDWTERLIVNWSENEKKQLEEWLKEEKREMERHSKPGDRPSWISSGSDIITRVLEMQQRIRGKQQAA